MIETPKPISDPGDIVELTRRLVQIPSYVHLKDSSGISLPESERVDERNIGNYIYSFLTEHTELTVTKQEVSDGRFNVIATNSEKPRIFLLGHMDTVKKSEDAPFDPFAAEIHDGKIYGLGASDMKAGLAGVMSSLATLSKLPDLYAAFYIDEEYDFAGMKKMLEEIPTSTKPELIFSADGGNMSVGNGCRGFSKVKGALRGRTAHAARPHHGVDAINGVTNAMQHLQGHLTQYGHEFLGNSTVVISRLDGGKSAIENGKEIITDGGNKVADLARFALDIRTTPGVNAELITQILLNYCTQSGLQLENLNFPNEEEPWITELKDIQNVIQAVEKVTGESVKINDASEFGYIDLQMIWKALGKPSAAMFGPEITPVAHTRDEHVKIDDVLKAKGVFSAVIDSYIK